MTFTAAEKRTFDPGPCPSCGGTDIHTEWVHVPFATQVDDSWVPGESQCWNPECGRIFVGGSQAHNPASPPDDQA